MPNVQIVVFFREGGLPIGFLIGSCGVYLLAKYSTIAGFIPFAFILVDTTFTLFNRIKKRLNPFKSHNHHGYQIASQNAKTDTSIRSYCLIANISNTVLATICFQFNHKMIWQVILGTSAFVISFSLFLFLKSGHSIKTTNPV